VPDVLQGGWFDERAVAVRSVQVDCDEGPDRRAVQDVQEPHMQPLQEDLRQVPGDLLHDPHGGKGSHEVAKAIPAQAVLGLQRCVVGDTPPPTCWRGIVI
ncbi:MAG: hypothetical protein ACREA7_08970, partial [Nitrosotalea sp.]